MLIIIGILGENSTIPILSGIENWPVFENNFKG